MFSLVLNHPPPHRKTTIIFEHGYCRGKAEGKRAELVLFTCEPISTNTVCKPTHTVNRTQFAILLYQVTLYRKKASASSVPAYLGDCSLRFTYQTAVYAAFEVCCVLLIDILQEHCCYCLFFYYLFLYCLCALLFSHLLCLSNMMSVSCLIEIHSVIVRSFYLKNK